jgi:hypothetical protein
MLNSLWKINLFSSFYHMLKYEANKIDGRSKCAGWPLAPVDHGAHELSES